MPPFEDLLVCAVSSSLRHQCEDFDEIINKSEKEFLTTGLKVTSLIRLGMLATIPETSVLGILGRISFERLTRLQNNLPTHIQKSKS